MPRAAARVLACWVKAWAASTPRTAPRSGRSRYRSAVRVTQGMNTHTVVHAIDGDKAAVWIDGRSMPVSATHRAQLLQALDLAPTLDLDGDVRTPVVAAEEIDRADVGGVFAPDQRPAVAEDAAAVGQQLLEVPLDPVLDQPGIDAKVVGGVVEDLPDLDGH